MCVCECVCVHEVRDRQADREIDKQREKETDRESKLLIAQQSDRPYRMPVFLSDHMSL